MMSKPNGPADCDCFNCDGKESGRGEDPCEYYNHHCDSCHERNLCTKLNCEKEIIEDV